MEAFHLLITCTLVQLKIKMWEFYQTSDLYWKWRSTFGWTEVEEDWLIYDGVIAVEPGIDPQTDSWCLCSSYAGTWLTFGWFDSFLSNQQEPRGECEYCGLWSFALSVSDPGHKTVSERAELDRWLVLEPTSQSFTHCPWVPVHRNPYVCLDGVHINKTAIIQAP